MQLHDFKTVKMHRRQPSQPINRDKRDLILEDNHPNQVKFKHKKSHSFEPSEQRNKKISIFQIKESDILKKSNKKLSNQYSVPNKAKAPTKMEKNNGIRQKKGSKIVKTGKKNDNPMSSKQVIEKYKNILSNYQLKELKQWKWIYFFGKNLNNQTNSNKNNEDQISYPQVHEGRQKNLHTEQQTVIPQITNQIAYQYQIIQQIGKGAFGSVHKVYDHKTKQFMAVKIVKEDPVLVKQSFIELKILTAIKQIDKQNLSGIVQVKDFLIFRNKVCIFFQLLSQNLFRLLEANNFQGLAQDIVRIFAIQILNSLNFLSKMKIIHCDIKPENIALKNWGKSGIKLIDFSSSCFEGKQIYEYIQSRFYRAPQVILKFAYSIEIDMWSLGCVIAQLRLGKPLFVGENDLEQFVYFTKAIGLPPIKSKIWTHKLMQDINQLYLYQLTDSLQENSQKIIQGYSQKYGDQLKQQCLQKLEKRFNPNQKLFIDFLKKIFVWDPKNRLTPAQALQHPWIISGLPQGIRQLYTIFQRLEMLNKQTKKVSNSINKKKRSQSKSISKAKKNKQTQKSINKLKSNDLAKTSLQNQSINRVNASVNNNSINIRNQTLSRSLSVKKSKSKSRSRSQSISKQRSKGNKYQKQKKHGKIIKNLYINNQKIQPIKDYRKKRMEISSHSRNMEKSLKKFDYGLIDNSQF